MKIILFTHGIDIDGYGCAVLAKLAFGEQVEINYADNFELDEMFAQRIYSASVKDILEERISYEKLFKNAQKNLKDIDQIYITDHCISFPLCKFVNIDRNTVQKMHILDHHESRLSEQGQFPWVVIGKTYNKNPVCGTKLFYNYLLKNNLLSGGNDLLDWTELTNLYDTWTWKNSGHDEDSLKLDILGKALGREEYVNHFTKRFSKDKQTSFEFMPEEEKIIEQYRIAYIKKLNEYIQKIQIIEFDGLKAGLVHIKDLFKNDIAEKVRSLPLGKEIDFLLMPIDDRESVSLRNINPNCDVSKIAQTYGGGGHFGAASFPKKNLKEATFIK